MMEASEIFSALIEYSNTRHDHPDQVARVYAGLQDVAREFFGWSEKQREGENEGIKIQGLG